jgi:hypothetical protein
MQSMSLLPLFRWLNGTYIGATIRGSTNLFPIIEFVHLLGLVVLLGSIFVVDMRLLGIGLRRQPITRLARELAPVTFGGFIVMFLTGGMLVQAEALKCYQNDAFWVKMEFLAAAILFYTTVHRKVTGSDHPSPVWGRITALLSLTLWFGVGWAGRAIAFV